MRKVKFGLMIVAVLLASTLTACKEYPPKADAVSVAVQSTDPASVTASWPAVTDPAGGSLQYLWENRQPDATVADSGTTGFTTITVGSERDWTDQTWTFCVRTQRIEDGLTSGETCQSYIVPAREATAPPAVESITITVE